MHVRDAGKARDHARAVGIAQAALDVVLYEQVLVVRGGRQAVVDVLVKDYGIPANRLKVSADGGVDKFGQPILNRVVLVKSAN